VGATNRKQDLDSAILSRFSSIIQFQLPEENERQEIWSCYAKHLSQTDRAMLAKLSEGFVGRDIREAAARTERLWLSKVIENSEQNKVRNLESALVGPPAQLYIDSIIRRKQNLKLPNTLNSPNPQIQSDV